MKHKIFFSAGILATLSLVLQLTSACGPSGKKRPSIRQAVSTKKDRNGDDEKAKREGCEGKTECHRNPKKTPDPDKTPDKTSSSEGSQAIHLNGSELTTISSKPAQEINVNGSLFTDSSSPLTNIVSRSSDANLTVDQLESGEYELQAANFLINQQINKADSGELIRLFIGLSNIQDGSQASDALVSQLPSKLPFKLALKLPLLKKLVIDANTDPRTLITEQSAELLILADKTKEEKSKFQLKSLVQSGADKSLDLESDAGFVSDEGYEVEGLGLVNLRSTDISDQQSDDHELHVTIDQTLDDGKITATTVLIYKRAKP